jgi:fused signal recognition particle receptor
MFSFFKKKPKDIPAPQQESAQHPAIEENGAEVAPAIDTSVQETVDAAASPSAEQKRFGFFHKKPKDAPALEQEMVRKPASETNAAEIAQEEEIVPAAPLPAELKKSWVQKLKAGLSKTSSNLTTLFVGAKIDEDLYEELESALLMSDAGVEATQLLLNALKKKVKDEKLTEAAQVKTALRSLLIDLLRPLQKPLMLGRHQPLVMMIAGVNGAGKTTTIGKLAMHLQAHDQSVLLAAGDTFRAAAREQLAIWGERNNVSVIAQESGDPAAVAFDAVQSAKARGLNVVMVDTAGRLPTQLHLMEELKKIKRVIGKGMETAPHEVLLVIDGNTGQNALAQVKAFDDALTLTGLVITKLDGTAKGGILAAIAKTRPVPVYFIGVGEKLEDLQPFNAEEFVDALLS